MARSSISASFNSEEIDRIDRVCKKLGITQGQLIKDAVTFWMLEKPFNELRNSKTDIFSAISSIRTLRTLGDNKFPAYIVEGKFGKPSMDETLSEIRRRLSEFNEEHDAYHVLASKKPIGRPRIKKKRGRPIDTGLS
jgi:hypothetical protein